jgi:hypothetical protein
MPPEPQSGLLREVALLFGLTTVASLAILALTKIELLKDVGLAALALLYLLIAIRAAQRETGGIRRYGIHLAGLLEPPKPDDGPPGPFGIRDLLRALGRATKPGAREAAFALGVAALTFPPFIVGFYFWNSPTQPFSFQLPPATLSFCTAQILIVALPEEALFRGYFQTRLADAWPARREILGALISPRSLVMQAALFALLHFIVDPHPARLAVFFPALIFGWMRARRGGIGSAMTYHALCNILSDILFRSWLG